MSVLGENLFAKPSRDLYAEPVTPMSCFSKHESWDSIPPLYREYRVSVRLETRFIVDDSFSKDSDIYLLAVRDSKQKIIEEVFGEFKRPLYELRQDAMQRGAYDMAKKINDILDQMFKHD